MRLSRALKEKRPQYQERHDKVILQHDNARPHVARPVKTYVKMKKSKNGSIRGSPQKTHRFFEMVSDNCQKDGKEEVVSDGKYFES